MEQLNKKRVINKESLSLSIPSLDIYVYLYLYIPPCTENQLKQLKYNITPTLYPGFISARQWLRKLFTCFALFRIKYMLGENTIFELFIHTLPLNLGLITCKFNQPTLHPDESLVTARSSTGSWETPASFPSLCLTRGYCLLSAIYSTTFYGNQTRKSFNLSSVWIRNSGEDKFQRCSYSCQLISFLRQVFQ